MIFLSNINLKRLSQHIRKEICRQLYHSVHSLCPQLANQTFTMLSLHKVSLREWRRSSLPPVQSYLPYLYLHAPASPFNVVHTPSFFFCFFVFWILFRLMPIYLVCMYSVASKSIKAPLVILAVQYSLHGKLFFSPWLRAFSLKVTFLWVFPPSSITLTTHRTLKKGNKSEKAKKEKKKKEHLPFRVASIRLAAV